MRGLYFLLVAVAIILSSSDAASVTAGRAKMISSDLVQSINAPRSDMGGKRFLRSHEQDNIDDVEDGDDEVDSDDEERTIKDFAKGVKAFAGNTKYSVNTWSGKMKSNANAWAKSQVLKNLLQKDAPFDTIYKTGAHPDDVGKVLGLEKKWQKALKTNKADEYLESAAFKKWRDFDLAWTAMKRAGN